MASFSLVNFSQQTCSNLPPATTTSIATSTADSSILNPTSTITNSKMDPFFTPDTTSNTTPPTTINFDGDLRTMMYNWDQQEICQARRLVKFWSRKENNVITCGFQPLSNTDNIRNETIVSCICWRERGYYVFTSVDCIGLLESLLNVQFTVEEKNRVRRNLEGFRPLTISKCNPSTSGFFKQVMEYNHPKPRNIEKDLKVFSWKIIQYALQKIISKYSTGFIPSRGTDHFDVSLSNLASALPSPLGGNFPDFNNNLDNMQRRFSQPVNALPATNRFHPYSINHRINRFSSNVSSRRPSLSDLPEDFMMGTNFNTPIMNQSLASLNLETNMKSLGFSSGFSSPQYMNLPFDTSSMVPVSTNFMEPAPRRHSLADSYSLKQFQQTQLNNPISNFNNTTFIIPEEDENFASQPYLDFTSSASMSRDISDNSYNFNMHNSNMSTIDASLAFMEDLVNPSFILAPTTLPNNF